MKKIHKWERRIIGILKRDSEWDALEDYYTLDVVRVLNALPSLERMTCRSFALRFAEKKERISFNSLISRLSVSRDVEIIFQPPVGTEFPFFLLEKDGFFISIKDYWRSGNRTYKKRITVLG